MKHSQVSNSLMCEAIAGYALNSRERATTTTMTLTAQNSCATVLFVDLRGYTRLAEQLPATRVVPLLDEFLGMLTIATERHGGQIFHVAGDGLMAGFGLQDVTHDGALEAIAAGRAMLARFEPIAVRWHREFAIVTGIGIGIHRGEVARAYLGPPGKKTLTLIGDTVNVAARLCNRARAGEVLFSGTVATSDDAITRPIPEPLPFLRLPQFALRGRTAPLDIWCVPAQERLAV
jgi:adenylate cyclase